MEIYLKFQLDHPNAKMPVRGTPHSAGLDVFTPEFVSIEPHGHKVIGLGIRSEFTPGYMLQAMEKSGVSTKHMIDIGACVIDSDYRGEIKIHLINNSDQEVIFYSGEKIAQLVMIPVCIVEPTQGQVDMETQRGEGGFGSTGRF